MLQDLCLCHCCLNPIEVADGQQICAHYRSTDHLKYAESGLDIPCADVAHSAGRFIPLFRVKSDLSSIALSVSRQIKFLAVAAQFLAQVRRPLCTRCLLV